MSKFNRELTRLSEQHDTRAKQYLKEKIHNFILNDFSKNRLRLAASNGMYSLKSKLHIDEMCDTPDSIFITIKKSLEYLRLDLPSVIRVDDTKNLIEITLYWGKCVEQNRIDDRLRDYEIFRDTFISAFNEEMCSEASSSLNLLNSPIFDSTRS